MIILNDNFIFAATAQPTLTNYLPRVVYAEVGKKLTLQCDFDGTFVFTTWTNASNIDLYPLQEYPNCVRISVIYLPCVYMCVHACVDDILQSNRCSLVCSI